MCNRKPSRRFHLDRAVALLLGAGLALCVAQGFAQGDAAGLSFRGCLQGNAQDTRSTRPRAAERTATLAHHSFRAHNYLRHQGVQQERRWPRSSGSTPTMSDLSASSRSAQAWSGCWSNSK